MMVRVFRWRTGVTRRGNVMMMTMIMMMMVMIMMMMSNRCNGKRDCVDETDEADCKALLLSLGYDRFTVPHPWTMRRNT